MNSSSKKVNRRLGVLQMVSNRGLQHSNQMDSLAYRYVVNFVIWKWDYMFTYWHTCYRKDNIQYMIVKVHKLGHLETCAWMHVSKFI